MHLALLWHLHQPVYRRPHSRDYVLPWVSFHAVKNYYQMARLVEEAEFPCTFNFVPCLLEQIEDYAQGRARDPYQLALEIPPDRLGLYEIERLKKFVADSLGAEKLQLRALQSFFSPIDEIPEDKTALLIKQKEILAAVIPFYRRLYQEGKIELTVSPYYHPLLPLVFDLKAAGSEAPSAVSFHYPEDSNEQMRRGREYFSSVFGRYPKGMWPPEGGISTEVARGVAQAGFAFAVTDENILWKSVPAPAAGSRKNLFKPYCVEGISVFFRDRELSDLLGFAYFRLNEKDAVDDFLHRLAEREPLAGEDGIVVLALDGENPWGNYRQNGLRFLRELFGRLKKESSISPVFFEDYLARAGPGKEMAIVPGTWLGNFSKWAGSAAKNEGWKTLARARKACGPSDELLIAEASDWFWWLGEPKAEEFSFLFRSYIQEAYRRASVRDVP
jgi:alpha-amylase/alpha-mannosidase (GH57 family)